MYKIIYKDVVLFHTSNKNEAIDAILTYATKRGLTFDKKIKIFGRIKLVFYDANNYYTYTIIRK